MHRLCIKWGRWFFPILGCIALFLFMHVMQTLGGFDLPTLSVVGLAIVLGVTLLGYVLRLNILNRIGGWAIVFVAAIIIAGTLLPKPVVATYPEKASHAVTRDFDAAWKAIYGKDLFKEFSLHQHLMQYAESLSRFDIHRVGQMGLFGLFGFAISICFLFPIDPSYHWKYWSRFLLLLIAAGLWSLQTELLQVLSPTRPVSFVDFLESLIGTFLGVLLCTIGSLIYLHYKKSLEDRRFNVLGVGIDAVNMDDCLDLFKEMIAQGTGGMGHGVCGGATLECDGSAPLSDGNIASANNQQPTTINLSSGLKTRLPAMTTAMGVAGIVESRRNQKLQRILNESVLNTPDGMPLVWLGKLFGQRRIERVYGPDLLRDACAYGADKGWRHFFYGAAPGIAEKLKEVMEQKHPGIEIAGIYCPPFRPLTEEEENEVVGMVNSSGADIFWIGISTPRQLYFMDSIRDKLNCKIVCPVGYAFDVNAGVEKDAPDWIKVTGLQWLHRGIKQPRLWKRYLPDNPTFVLKIFAQIFRLKKFTMFRHERPEHPLSDMDGYPRFPAGVVSLSVLTLQDACVRVEKWIETGQKHHVSICSTDTIVQCYDQPALAKIIMEAGMAIPASMPLVWLARCFGFRDSARICDADLILGLCSSSAEKGHSHYFYGATDEALGRLRGQLMEKIPELNISGMYAPPGRPLEAREKDEIVAMINEANPDIVWCCLGNPESDYWVGEFRLRLDCAAIVAIGGTLDIRAGYIRRAPSWVMHGDRERLLRLHVGFHRFWRRSITSNPRFVMQTFRQWFRARTIRRHLERSTH